MRAPRPFVRIIGGKWRGRRLPVPLTASFRPSGDRIREALFNCLGGSLDGRICLDLFAGTGALGLEAASRGAAKVVFVERDAKSLARTAEVAKILNADNRAEFSAVRADIFAWLASGGGWKRSDSSCRRSSAGMRVRALQRPHARRGRGWGRGAV